MTRWRHTHTHAHALRRRINGALCFLSSFQSKSFPISISLCRIQRACTGVSQGEDVNVVRFSKEDNVWLRSKWNRWKGTSSRVCVCIRQPFIRKWRGKKKGGNWRSNPDPTHLFVYPWILAIKSTCAPCDVYTTPVSTSPIYWSLLYCCNPQLKSCNVLVWPNNKRTNG